MDQDEALKARLVAEGKIQSEDYVGAKKFVLKAQRLCPGLPGLSQLLHVLDVLSNAQDVRMNWHKVLQVECGADEDRVKKQYRKLLLLLHPDKNKAVGAGSAFQLVKDAWAVFSAQLERSKGTSRPKRQAACRQTAPPSMQNTGGTFWTVCTECSAPLEYPKYLENMPVRCSNCTQVFIAEDILQDPPDKGLGESVSSERYSGQQEPNSSEWKLKKDLHGEDRGKEEKVEASDEPHLPKAPGMEIEEEASVELVEPPPDSLKQKRKREEGHTVDVKSSTESGGESPTNGRESSHKRTSSIERGKPKTRRRKADVDITKKDNNKESEGMRSTKINGHGDSRVDESKEGLKGQIFAKLKHHVVEGFSFQNLQSIDMKEDQGSTGTEELGDVCNTSTIIQFKLAVTFMLLPLTGAGHVSNGSGNVNQANREVTEEDDQDSCNRPVPDSDIFNFDKGRQEECLAPGQIWALYDDDDSMPRYYARIVKVIAHPFCVRVQWLFPADSVARLVDDWLKAGFQYTCGEFKIGKAPHSQKSVRAFSHEMKVEKGENGTLRIYPQKGDVWAMYKKWKPVKGTTHECEPFEVISHYTENGGVEVTPLFHVSGSQSIFCRMGGNKQISIPKEELGKFSHQIPAHRLEGIEAIGLPENSMDLDTAAFTRE